MITAGLVAGTLNLLCTRMVLVLKSCWTALSCRKTVPPMKSVCRVLTTTALNCTCHSFLKNVSVISPTAGSFVMPSARVESCEFGDILNLKCWAAANLI